MSDIALPAIASPRIRWLRRYGLPTFGAAVIVAWVLAAILAPWITPHDPNSVDVAMRLRPPSAGNWLGTDALGRDVATRVIYGARVSLTVGMVVVLVGALFGLVIGGEGKVLGPLVGGLLVDTVSWRATAALRTRVRRSATGSFGIPMPFGRAFFAVAGLRAGRSAPAGASVVVGSRNAVISSVNTKPPVTSSTL